MGACGGDAAFGGESVVSMKESAHTPKLMGKARKRSVISRRCGSFSEEMES